MKHFAALALFLFSASVTAQIEHAPTVAQCQADQRLWLSQMQTNDPLPSFREMHQRNTEMDNCKRVHPANNVAYYNASAEIQSEQLNRLVDFVDRHNLGNKFIEEDAAGKRGRKGVLTTMSDGVSIVLLGGFLNPSHWGTLMNDQSSFLVIALLFVFLTVLSFWLAVTVARFKPLDEAVKDSKVWLVAQTGLLCLSWLFSFIFGLFALTFWAGTFFSLGWGLLAWPTWVITLPAPPLIAGSVYWSRIVMHKWKALRQTPSVTTPPACPGSSSGSTPDSSPVDLESP